MQLENRCSAVRGVCLSGLCPALIFFSPFGILLLFSHSPPPEFVPFFLFSLFYLWGAEANTAVFLYINSCTLKTIQLLTKLNLCGLVFSFRVEPPGANRKLSGHFLLKHECLSLPFLFFSIFSCLGVVLFHIPSHADTLTGMADFFHSCSDDTVPVHEPSTLHVLNPPVHLFDEALMISALFHQL